jgi:hypothetical protein
VGKITLNDTTSLPEVNTPEEKLIWVLEQMIQSSKMRESHLIRINSYNNAFFKNEIDLDPNSGTVRKNKDMYAAINVDYIFRVMGFIESFQGALAAAWRLSTKKQSASEEVLNILVNPEGHLSRVVEDSKKGLLSEEKKCRYYCIPLIGKEDESVASKLRVHLKEAFDRLEKSMYYSQRFRDEYNIVRNVYSHNYRFVFHDQIVPGIRPKYDESIIGIIQNSTNFGGDMVFIGLSQRLAMRKLVSVLSLMERWIYSNMMFTTIHNCQPVLPERVLFLDEESHREYDRIRESKNYRLSIPRLAAKVDFAVDTQYELIIEFLNQLTMWGDSLKIHLADGQENASFVKYLRDEYDRIQEIKEKDAKRNS